MRILTQDAELIRFKKLTGQSIEDPQDALYEEGELKSAERYFEFVDDGLIVKEGRKVDSKSLAKALIIVTRISSSLLLDPEPYRLAFMDDNGDVGHIHIHYGASVSLAGGKGLPVILRSVSYYEAREDKVTGLEMQTMSVRNVEKVFGIQS